MSQIERTAPTRSDLSDQIRAEALRVHWHDRKGGSECKALEAATKLLGAVTEYHDVLSAEIADCHHENQDFLPYDDTSRPEDS